MGRHRKKPTSSKKEKINSDLPFVNNYRLTQDSPLLPTEQKFLTEFLKTGNKSYAALKSGLCDIHGKKCTQKNAIAMANRTIAKVNVQAEIKRIMDEVKNESIATAQEVMAYFTDVMRGNVKDQFGLDVSIADRTKAAQELARRTIDLENDSRKKADSAINVTINWDRQDMKED